MESVVPWFLLVLFGAYHGINPGMGWLFALSAGLQAKNERALWLALAPIALGHAASVAVVALLVAVGLRFLPVRSVQLLTALLLLAFGVYKLFRWYRHPRWVGMKVSAHRLFLWSFLMATAHGAGLMIAPAMAEVGAGESVAPGASSQHQAHGSHETGLPQVEASDTVSRADVAHSEHFGSMRGWRIWIGVGIHTLSMLGVMGAVALLVYRKLGLRVLKTAWVNFDLIWAIALLVVGGVALSLVAMGKA